MINLTAISTTYETEVLNGWIYRIISGKAGAVIHRVPADQQLWAHGVVKQIYQFDEGQFVPACQSGLGVYADFRFAVEAIEAASKG